MYVYLVICIVPSNLKVLSKVIDFLPSRNLDRRKSAVTSKQPGAAIFAS